MWTVIVAFGISTLGFALLGWWEWVYLTLLLGVALGVAELLSKRETGITITERFRNRLKERPREVILGTVIFTISFVVILLHLWGVLP